ncbi:transposase [Corynebacterium auris]|uniref:transposase n=1 Tax=Corynebacterium auris TaxID=44750 RepID=UPI0025B2E7AB|nr:transposase [Corynebacterium auris]WJY68944.1 Transposase [Corynebacterium auris]
MPKNTYSDEFKADAVGLYETTEGASYSSISEDLGIARGTLKTWVHKARRDRGQIPSTSPAGADQGLDPEDELVRLRSEVQRLKAETVKLTTERDILRKAAKYFAGETTW